MAAIGRIIAVAALLAGSFGCRSGFNWEGVWKGDRAMQFTPGTTQDLQNSLKRVTLTLKPNGQFELDASGIPRDGVYETSGKEASLQTVNVFARPVENATTIKLKANEDGTITLQSPDTFDPHPIVLHRESQPPSSNVRNR